MHEQLQVFAGSGCLISSSCSHNIQADQLLVIDIATNALKTQEKSEKPIYHKDVAQIIKQQLDTAKGCVMNRNLVASCLKLTH